MSDPTFGPAVAIPAAEGDSHAPTLLVVHVGALPGAVQVIGAIHEDFAREAAAELLRNVADEVEAGRWP